MGYEVQRQFYTCYGKEVSNLITRKSGAGEGTVVIGAHYDTVPGTPGADDNASAVAGMLSLAGLLKFGSNTKDLIFVAFANEEPPCFGSANMGSMVYARQLRAQKTPVDVMICLEMIGYFSPETPQEYPIPWMRHIYPRTADFLAVVQILIYVGAISVLIILAIMLTRNVQRGSPSNRLRFPALVVAILFLGIVGFATISTLWQVSAVPPVEPTTAAIAINLFGEGGFILAVEIAAVLLLAAVLGAIVLAREK